MRLSAYQRMARHQHRMARRRQSVARNISVAGSMAYVAWQYQRGSAQRNHRKSYQRM